LSRVLPDSIVTVSKQDHNQKPIRKKIMKKTVLVLPSIMLAFAFISCERNRSMNAGTDIAEGEVLCLTLAEATSEEDHSVSMEPPGTFRMDGMMGKDMRPGMHHLSDCAQVTESGEEYPREIIIDFGEGCEDWRGNIKTGKIIIQISDDMKNEGATRTVTYENYTVRGDEMSGSRTVINKGKNEEGNWVIESQSDMTINQVEESVEIQRISNATCEWLTGFETAEKSDDSFRITGTGSITQNGSITFSRNIIVPLLVDRSCRYILSGQVALTNEEGTLVIDFGDGTCDNTATVTKDGVTEEMDLTKCKFRGRSRHKIGST
jgi:hypothetical protein